MVMTLNSSDSRWYVFVNVQTECDVFCVWRCMIGSKLRWNRTWLEATIVEFVPLFHREESIARDNGASLRYRLFIWCFWDAIIWLCIACNDRQWRRQSTHYTMSFAWPSRTPCVIDRNYFELRPTLRWWSKSYLKPSTRLTCTSLSKQSCFRTASGRTTGIVLIMRHSKSVSELTNSKACCVLVLYSLYISQLTSVITSISLCSALASWLIIFDNPKARPRACSTSNRAGPCSALASWLSMSLLLFCTVLKSYG